MSMIANKGVKILQSASQAKAENKTKDSQKKTEELLPYVMTDILVEEIMNLEHKQKGKEVEVKQISRRIPRDKFSAFEYALWYIHLQEKKNRERKREHFDPSSYFFFKKGNRY